MATETMLHIDGALGEGGGQILRSSLALSLCLGKPFRIINIRRARTRPGLMPQHLAAVNAAVAVGMAEVDGAERDSQQLDFIPHGIRAGEYHFDIGTAGSVTLVLQTILPALLTAPARSTITIEGGTHNPLAPPYEFFEQAFVPLINRMGAQVQSRLLRPGFYPVGGGRVELSIEPVAALKPLLLLQRGEIIAQRACAIISRLPDQIAQRELNLVGQQLDLPASALQLRHVDAKGPGNAVSVFTESKNLTEVFVGIGQRGIRAETVAANVVSAVHRYLAADVPVGEYLADQLLLPLALAGGGSFVTLSPSRHTLTNIEVIKQFTGIKLSCVTLATDRWRIQY